MKITVESTTKTVTLDGVRARIWEGRTETGIAVHAFITRVAVDQVADLSDFEHELESNRAPSTEVAAYPLRLLL